MEAQEGEGTCPRPQSKSEKYLICQRSRKNMGSPKCSKTKNCTDFAFRAFTSHLMKRLRAEPSLGRCC